MLVCRDFSSSMELRHLSMMVLGLFSFFLVFSPKQVLGNDAPINLQSGGAQPLSGPLSVSMKSEVVTIKLGKDSYIVDAMFDFLNTGKTVKLNVGFPKNGEGWLDTRFSHTSDFIKFETWVDGSPASFAEEPNSASVEGHYTLPELIKHIKRVDDPKALQLRAQDYRWMVKKVIFPSNTITTTRVRYEAPYQDFGECKAGMTYIYGTGSYWRGNIGESRFIVDATALPQDDRPKTMHFDKEIDKSKLMCSEPHDGILECMIKEYKPSQKGTVIVTYGCVDE